MLASSNAAVRPGDTQVAVVRQRQPYCVAACGDIRMIYLPSMKRSRLLDAASEHQTRALPDLMAGSSPVPIQPGFFWALWHTADPATPDGAIQVQDPVWGVVEVLENCGDPDDPRYLRVLVPGVEVSQAIDNFAWGPGPLKTKSV